MTDDNVNKLGETPLSSDELETVYKYIGLTEAKKSVAFNILLGRNRVMSILEAHYGSITELQKVSVDDSQVLNDLEEVLKKYGRNL